MLIQKYALYFNKNETILNVTNRRKHAVNAQK